MLTLADEQGDWLDERIPDPVRDPRGGRPPMDKRQAIRGIFWILDHGAKWKALPRRFGNRSAVPRWFKKWVEDGVFEDLMRDAGQCIEERDGYRPHERFIDGTFAKAKGGGDGIGCTKAGKGVKIMVLLDARGMPVAVDTAPANTHERKLVRRLFDFMLPVESPQRIIGDKAYDGDALDQDLADDGLELIAPHRGDRKPDNKTRVSRPLRRYKRRWTAERTIAWLQNYRRPCIRWEKSTAMFQDMLPLGCTVLLLKKVLGAGLDRLDAQSREAYRRAGAADAWRLCRSPGGHQEIGEMRRQSRAFLKQWL